MDDVLAQSTKTFIRIIENEFGKAVRFEDIHSFDLKKSFGLSDMEFDHFFELAHRPETIVSYESMPGAVESLENWSNKGYDISIVTGRLTCAYEASKHWLINHKVPHNAFLIVNKYGRGEMDPDLCISLEELSEKKFGFAVEDSATMAQYIARKMETPVLLYDRPWNRVIDNDDAIHRFTSWKTLAASATGFLPE